MKINTKDLPGLIGEYFLAFVVGLFLGMIADMVIQSLMGSINVLACRVAEATVCLVVLSGFLGFASGRMAYKQNRVDTGMALLALAPIVALQLLLAWIMGFVPYISGAGFWLGVLFCHGSSGDTPYVDTPQGYFLLGMVLCIVVYGAVACVGQHIGYKQRIKSRQKMMKE